MKMDRVGQAIDGRPRLPGALKVQWLKQDLRSGLSRDKHDLGGDFL